MKMRTLRSSILCLVILLLVAPLLRAQDLSKYRHFTLGMNLTNLLERTEQKLTDVKTIHGRPALIQELTWWPPNVPGTSVRSDGVEQILFSFYNSELYKISVAYDRSSTEGLTEADMVKSVSVKYGPATIVALGSRFGDGRPIQLETKASGVLGGCAIFLQSCPFFLQRCFGASRSFEASQCASRACVRRRRTRRKHREV